VSSDKAYDSNEDNALNLQTYLSTKDFTIFWISIEKINTYLFYFVGNNATLLTLNRIFDNIHKTK